MIPAATNGRSFGLVSGDVGVFIAEYKNGVIGFIHAQLYDVLYFESMVNILRLAVD